MPASWQAPSWSRRLPRGWVGRKIPPGARPDERSAQTRRAGSGAAVYSAGVLLLTLRASLLCTVLGLPIALASCASGGGDDSAYTGDDGGSPSLQDGGDGSLGDATSGDSATGHDTGTNAPGDATADTTPSDTSPSDNDAGETDAAPVEAAPPGDSSSTCAGHGFSGALVTFDLSAAAGNEASAAATTSAAGVTGGALSRAAGLTAASGSGSINSSGWPTATTADPSLYYTFTVTPAAGCTVGLTSLALDVQASSTGPKHVEVGTSADGYASLSTPVAGTSSGNVTLSATATGALTVHVFGYGASGTAGTLRIQKTLTLSGTLQ